ncbi:MAG: signal recognition particle protein [Alphaproteobacteria bacterium]
MFNGLSSKLGDIFDGLKKRGSLRVEDVEAALKDIRLALLEADVALPAVKSFIEQVKSEATGASVIKSISPGQQVVKIVHDAMVNMLASALDEDGNPIPATLNLFVPKPAVILMVGLQGSGKTTTSAKIAHHLVNKQNKKILLASLDVQRPAAQEQLRQLAETNGLSVLPIIQGQDPIAITKRALQAAKLGAYDALILDSAGRTTIDIALMNELEAVKKAANPTETLLVADAMTGQDAARTGDAFHQQLGLSGVVLTRIDGDARGGAALSMRHVTGMPIKFLGVGEGIGALEQFDAKRIAGRILDMGDIVSLVEKAAETIEQDEAEKLAKKMQKGRFDLNDMATQLQQMKKMGGAGSLMNMIPGMGQMMKQVDPSKLDGKNFARQAAIISSMTKAERKNPDLLHASRKRRIAAGSGTSPNEVNRLLKQHAMMAKMMKQMAQGGGGLMGALTKMMGAGGNSMPAGMMSGAGMGGAGMGGMPADLGAMMGAMPRKKTNNKRKKKRK